MLDKKTFEQRKQAFETLFQEKKNEGKFDDWETQFWNSPHIRDKSYGVLFNENIKSPVRNAAALLMISMIEKIYLFDYDEYCKINDVFEKLFLMPSNVQPEKYEIIKKYLNKDTLMFEWGSGYSTIHFAKICRFVFSVESDPFWLSIVNMVSSILNIDNIGVVGSFFPPHGQGPENTTYPYAIKDISQANGIKSFDVILVDGRMRERCLENALPFLHDDSVVIVDDYDRDHPEGILEKYSKIVKDNFKIIERTDCSTGLVVLKKIGNKNEL
jgi:predicted O-methyltransferase YrrM